MKAKRLVALLLVISLLFGIAACKKQPEETVPNGSFEGSEWTDPTGEDPALANEEPVEENTYVNPIVNGGFETGDLTGWITLEGTALTAAGVVSTNQYYWTDRAVYGEGEYYLDGNNNGTIAENLTGVIRSGKFTLGGDGYITFMIGAGNGDCYVAVCDDETDEELIVVRNDYFSDPALALTLLRVYVDASEYIGKDLYMKVVDANNGSGFAFLNVDDFRASLTAEDVAALEVEQLEKIQNETYTSASYDDLTSLLNYYNNYPYPVPLASMTMVKYAQHQVVDCGTVDLTAFIKNVRAVYGDNEVTDFAISKVSFEGKEVTGDFKAFKLSKPGTYEVTYSASYDGRTMENTFTVIAMEDDKNVANGGFESGNLAGWTVRTEGWSIVEGNAAGVISAESYWDEKLPYNQEGDYHLDGWNTGIDESDTWQVRSTNFTLSGSGYISVRMGGHAAAVRVYLSNGKEVGYFKQNRFRDAGFPSLAAGGSWADMGTYVMDLREYLGKEMYIVLCDEKVDGWAHAFFDEVITYYEEAPTYSENADVVADGGTGKDVKIPWRLAINQHDIIYFYMTSSVKNQVMKSGTLNLNNLVRDARAVYQTWDDSITIRDFKVTKVTLNGTAVSGNYAAFEFNEPGSYQVTYTATYLDKSVSATFTVLVSDGANVVNGGFETGDLTGWTVLTDGWGTSNGKPTGVISDSTYWAEKLPYNQAGSYHLDGWYNGIGEGDTWKVRSSNFTLSGSGYISVRMGGKAAAVRVYLADGTEIGYYKQTRFNDVNFPSLAAGGSWADMGTYVIDLGTYLGQEMYVVLCDEPADGWAHAFFDELVTYYAATPDYANNYDVVADSVTGDEVHIPWRLANNDNSSLPPASLAITSYAQHQAADCGIVDLNAFLKDASAAYGTTTIDQLTISKVTFQGAEINEGFDAFDMSKPGYYVVTYGASYNDKTAEASFTIVAMADRSSVANGGFESGNLAGWTVLNENWGKAEGHATGVISASTYWGENLPYNQAGSYHLDGWNNGIGEGDTWQVRSTNFTLSGSGFISLRMGGNAAAFRVYLADGTEIAYYKQNRFNDANFPSLAAGGSWADMGTYVVDLSAYLGQEMYIVLCDEQANGWAHAFFDEVVTYYAAAPDYASNYDMVADSVTGDEVHIPWQLLGDLNTPGAPLKLSMTSYAQHKVVDCGIINLEDLLADASATYGTAVVTDFAVSKVSFQGTEVTEGFDAFDMSKPGYYVVTYGISRGEQNVGSSFTVVAMENRSNVANGGFESGNLAGWTVLNSNWGTTAEGHATGVISASTYWGENMPYNQAGSFHLDGWNNGIGEGDTWQVRSTNFTLSGSGFISLRMGGNAAAVRVHLADGTEIAHFQQNRFNDANFPSLAAGGSWADMGTYVVDLSAYLGQEMYIVLCDEEAAGWAHAFFDEVVTYYAAAPDYANNYDVVADSVTGDEVHIPWQLLGSLNIPDAPATLTMTAYAQHKVVDCGIVDLGELLTDVSATYGTAVVTDFAVSKVSFQGTEITEGFDAFDMSKPGYYYVTYGVSRGEQTVEGSFTVVALENRNSVANSGFESGNLAGWTVLNSNWGTTVEGHATGVISANTYWGENMPYNQAGSFHLDGWNNGIGEGDTWQVRSTNFTLSGSGYISLRMGGHAAAVRVYLADGTEIAHYQQTRFNDANFPSLAAGGSWADMGTYVINLSAYVGQEMYIVLCDEEAAGWAHAFFDEVVTYYASVPDYANHYDVVADGVTGDEVHIPWQLLGDSGPSEPPAELTMTCFIQHKVVDCGTVDLTAFLAEAAATYGSEAVTDFAITKVSFQGNEITEGFDAFDMSKAGYYRVTYGASRGEQSVEGTFTIVAMANHNVIANGGFESGNLAGWTVLNSNWGTTAEGHATGVISATTYWGENLPYNQAGSFHLDGWYNGIGEGDTWQVRSTNFTLSGSGYISLRMGGHAAAVRVYLADGTQIAHYQQNRFNDANFPSLAAGGSWADMGTYVINLSAYIGQEMYIVLCDEPVAGWAHAFFDEVVTYYASVPDYANHYDVVADSVTGDEVHIPWQLAGSSAAPTVVIVDSETEQTDETESTPDTDEQAEENAAPEITGVNDKSVETGVEFDALEGVTASDAEDGDITAQIVVRLGEELILEEGKIILTTAGTYELTYSVTDANGVTTEVTATLTVADPIDTDAEVDSEGENIPGEAPEEENPEADTAEGDIAEENTEDRYVPEDNKPEGDASEDDTLEEVATEGGGTEEEIPEDGASKTDVLTVGTPEEDVPEEDAADGDIPEA